MHAIELRDLISTETSEVEAVVRVDIGPRNQYIDVQSRGNSCVVDRVVDLVLEETSRDEMEAQNLSITVWNKLSRRKDAVIGFHDISLALVHSLPQREVYRQWFGLMSRTDNAITGYLRASVSVLGPLESTPPHGLEEHDEENADIDAKPNIPVSLKRRAFHLFIRLFRGADMPHMDVVGVIDPYVNVRFGGVAPQKTRTLRNTTRPEWNTELRFPVWTPMLSDRILIEVFDYNQGGANVLVASTEISWNDLMSRSPAILPARFYPLYSAQPGATMMAGLRLLRSGECSPSAYSGRLLIEVEAINVEKPKSGKRENLLSPPDPVTVPHTIWFDLIRASELEAPDLTQCNVELCIGATTIMSMPTTIKDGGCVWNQQMDEFALDLDANPASRPDVFVNIYGKSMMTGVSERMGFVRIPLSTSSFLSGRQWLVLTADPVFLAAQPAAQQSPMAGFIECSLQIGPEVNRPIQRKEIKRISEKKFELRAHIYQGMHLHPSADDGTCNPYVLIALGGSSAVTRVVHSTCYPAFYTTLSMPVSLPQPLSLAAPLRLVCLDRQFAPPPLAHPDEPKPEPKFRDVIIGEVTVPLAKIEKRFPSVPEDLKLESATFPRKGVVIASFQLIPADEISRPEFAPVAIFPEMRDVLLEIGAVGLRDLLPFNFVSVENAQLEFDTGDRSDPSKIQRTNICEGNNPNILQTITQPMRVPTNPRFCPHLNIRCFDHRLGGAPVVGVAATHLGKYLPWVDENDLEPESSDEEGSLVVTYLEPEVSIEPLSEAWNILPHQTLSFITPARSKRTTKAGFGVRTLPEVDEMVIPDMERMGRSEVAASIDDDDDEMGGPTSGAIAEDPITARPVVDSPLEDRFENHPFEEFVLLRGNARTSRTTREVGTFKARIRIIEISKRNMYPKAVSLRGLFQPMSYVVRLYLLRGRQLVGKDNSGFSDPFLVVHNGVGPDHHKDFSDRLQRGTLNPDFGIVCEIKATLPGDAHLTIECWDWDLGGNDLIGKTVIDVESRLFSEEWKNMVPKPVETRPLTHPTSLTPQGYLDFWMEIMTTEEALEQAPLNLKPPAPTHMTLRLVIWKVRDVFPLEKQFIDLFATACVDGLPPQQTDMHPLAHPLTNPPEFNWRCVFHIPVHATNMAKNPRLLLALYDKEFVGANDALAEAVVSLIPMYKEALLRRNRDKKDERIVSLAQQWVTLFHPNVQGEMGKILVSMDMLPMEDNLENPVGMGRGEPNNSPKLRRPTRPSAFMLRVRALLAWVRAHPKITFAITFVIVIVIAIPTAMK